MCSTVCFYLKAVIYFKQSYALKVQKYFTLTEVFFLQNNYFNKMQLVQK